VVRGVSSLWSCCEMKELLRRKKGSPGIGVRPEGRCWWQGYRTGSLAPSLTRRYDPLASTTSSSPHPHSTRATRCSWMARSTSVFWRRVRLMSRVAAAALLLPLKAPYAAAAAAAVWN
jgi:hypothetical protein